MESEKTGNLPNNVLINREQILCELWQSRDLSKAIGRMKPEDLQDDLRQEIFVVLCEMDGQRLKSLWMRGQLSQYIFGIMWTMMQGHRTTFYNTHRRFSELVSEEPNDLTPDNSDAWHETIDNLEPAINELDPYEADMIKLYIDMGQNCQPIAQATGIQVRSVRYVVTAAKEKLKKRLRQNA